MFASEVDSSEGPHEGHRQNGNTPTICTPAALHASACRHQASKPYPNPRDLAHAKGSRAEAGCLRFDVLRDNDNPNRFFFYEAYVDAAAVDVHKAQPHFKLWSDFKASGGCTSVSTKATPLGDWGFQ